MFDESLGITEIAIRLEIKKPVVSRCLIINSIDYGDFISQKV
jgi:hypothetical protein